MKKFPTLLLIVAIALAMVSCSNENMEEATIRFSMSRSSRTISPEADLDISQYIFSFTGITDPSNNFQRTIQRTEAQVYTIAGVRPGKYTVKVSGCNTSGTVLAESTGEYRFLAGLNTYSISLNALKGNGSLALTFRWNPALFLDKNEKTITPTLSLTLADQNGNAVTIAEGDKTMNVAEGTLVVSKNSIPSGSYVLTATIQNGSTPVSGIVQAIRISASTTTSGTIDFQMGKAADVEGFLVQDNTSSPIEATITTSKTFTPGGSEPISNVTFSLDFTKLPQGITAQDVDVQWYIEDFPAASTKEAVIFPAPGYATYTAVYKCEKIGSVGSTSLTFYAPEY